jgi:tRNA(adenine34) deaminase
MGLASVFICTIIRMRIGRSLYKAFISRTSLIKFIFGTMNDEHFMQQALRQAQIAFEADEVPVGAVVVIDNKIISRGYNQVEKLADPTAHAEIIALTSAFAFLGSKYLPDASMYVTVEPCLMCAGALYWSKISRIVYGASDEKNGYLHITKEAWPFHPKTELTKGILKEECAALIKSFFQQKR